MIVLSFAGEYIWSNSNKVWNNPIVHGRSWCYNMGKKTLCGAFLSY